jgi:hypothetical protein
MERRRGIATPPGDLEERAVQKGKRNFKGNS